MRKYSAKRDARNAKVQASEAAKVAREIRTGGAGVRALGEAFATAFGIRNGAAKMDFAGRTDVSLARELFAAHAVPASPGNFEPFFDTYVFG